MAQTGNPNTHSDIRGKLAGFSFSKSKGTGIIRQNPPAGKRLTVLQSRRRNSFTKFARNWQLMSQVTRDRWNAYALTQTEPNPLTGENYTPTGFQVYCQVGMISNLVSLTGSPTINPPTPALVWPNDNPVMSTVSATIRLTFATQHGTQLFIIGYAQLVRTANTKPRTNNYTFRAAGTINATPPRLTMAGLTAGVYYVAYRWWNNNTRGYSPMFYIGPITVS